MLTNGLTAGLKELYSNKISPRLTGKKKEIIKIMEEINQIETRKTIRKTNESKS